MMHRRFAYGTSEAVLHSLHPEKRKCLPWEPAPLATVALLSAAAVLRRPALAGATMVPFLWDTARRARRLRRAAVGLPAGSVWRSVARGHLSMLYFTYFHLTRYYLGPLAAVGITSRGARRLAALALVFAGTVDYVTKRPRLAYPLYLAYFLAEQAAYQVGVTAGCVRAGTFRSYVVALERSERQAAGSRQARGRDLE
jgi:hypothetical protein